MQPCTWNTWATDRSARGWLLQHRQSQDLPYCTQTGACRWDVPICPSLGFIDCNVTCTLPGVFHSYQVTDSLREAQYSQITTLPLRVSPWVYRFEHFAWTRPSAKPAQHLQRKKGLKLPGNSVIGGLVNFEAFCVSPSGITNDILRGQTCLRQKLLLTQFASPKSFASSLRDWFGFGLPVLRRQHHW